jgi:hypothetical protein
VHQCIRVWVQVKEDRNLLEDVGFSTVAWAEGAELETEATIEHDPCNRTLFFNTFVLNASMIWHQQRKYFGSASAVPHAVRSVVVRRR